MLPNHHPLIIQYPTVIQHPFATGFVQVADAGHQCSASNVAFGHETFLGQEAVDMTWFLDLNRCGRLNKIWFQFLTNHASTYFKTVDSSTSPEKMVVKKKAMTLLTRTKCVSLHKEIVKAFDKPQLCFGHRQNYKLI